MCAMKIERFNLLTDTKILSTIPTGKAAEITREQLNHFFAKVELNRLSQSQIQTQNLHAPALASQFLSRYGLRSAEDIRLFLDSPAGETVKEELGEVLAEEIAKEEYLEEKNRETIQRRHRLTAFILLYLAEKSAHATELREYIERELEKHFSQLNKKEKKAREELLHSHSNVEKALEEYTANEAILRGIEKELAKLATEEKMLNQTHAAYQKIFDSLETETHALLQDKPVIDLSPEDKIEALAKLNEKINDVKHQQHLFNSTKLPAIEAQLQTEQDLFARKLEFREKHLQRMRSVLMGNMKMYDQNFQEVHHPQKAHLFMPETTAAPIRQANKQILEKDGQFFLVKKGQKLEALSLEEKQEAKAHYNKEISPEKHARLRFFHQTQHADKVNAHTLRITLLKQKQLSLISHQIELKISLQKAQVWKASVEAVHLQVKPQLQAVMTAAPSQNSTTSNYRATINQFKLTPGATEPQDRLPTQLTPTNTAPEKRSPPSFMKPMKDTEQLHETKRLFLNKYGIKNELAAEKSKEQEQRPAQTAPNPFSTKPEPICSK